MNESNPAKKNNTSIPRIVPPVYLLLSIISMILLNRFLPLGYLLLYPWKYTGIAVIALGAFLVMGSFVLFRKSQTALRPGIPATAILTKGPFKYTRNPIYLGFAVILLGTALLLGSLSPLIIIPIFVWIIQSQFILREEKWMEEWFGEPYIDYKKKTPRWFF